MDPLTVQVDGRPNPAISIQRCDPNAILPVRFYKDDAGLDLAACLVSATGRPNTMLIPPRSVKRVPTGIIAVAPDGYRLEVCSRSGLAADAKSPLFVANAPGIIDPGYRGEIQVLLYNGGIESFYIKHGMRIAQLILVQHHTMNITEVEELPPSSGRDSDGFGSTGE